MSRRKQIVICVVILLALALAVAGVLFGVSSCSFAPPVEELRDDVAALLAASGEVNQALSGKGLPVLSRSDPAYADFYAYQVPESMSLYEVVDISQTPFDCEAAIRKATLAVYSEGVADPLLTAAFDGNTSDLRPGQIVVRSPMFMESGEYFYQLRRSELDRNYRELPTLTFDMDTLRVENPSNETSVLLSVTAYDQADPEIPLHKTFRIVLTDSGWRLDTQVV